MPVKHHQQPSARIVGKPVRSTVRVGQQKIDGG
jgi:hypothetical protein